MSDSILEISTTVKEPQTFTVDGQSYNLYDFDHLSGETEAKFFGALRRFGAVTEQYADSKDESKAAVLAAELRTLRLRLIQFMTSLPPDVTEKLPIEAQRLLIEKIYDALGQGADA